LRNIVQKWNFQRIRVTTRYTQSNRYYRFALVLIFIDYIIIGEQRCRRERYFRSVFVFWGKWWSISASGISRRLSPLLQTPRWNPQRSFGQWPRDYIFRRCAGWCCRKGLCPPNSLSPDITLREKFSSFLSYIQFINYQCIIIIICKIKNVSIYKTGWLYTFLFSTLIFLIL